MSTDEKNKNEIKEDIPLNFTCKISEVDIFGNVTLQFSDEIMVVDLKLINSSIGLYIKPAPLTIEVIDKIDKKAVFVDILDKKVLKSSEFLNFTWVPVYMTSTTIGLKLNFKYNFNVSSSDNLRDQLVVIVLDPLVFRTTKPTFLSN